MSEPRSVALIGDPVGESPSPAMQNAAFRAAGLPLEYVAVRVRRDDLAEAFPRLAAAHLGLNVTIPLKEAVVPLMDELAPEARLAGSVNTVAFRGMRAIGTSTDGEGFLRALRRCAPGTRPRTALVVGTGGAARAVTLALVRDAITVQVSGRDREKGARMARELGASFVQRDDVTGILSGIDLLASAVPAAAWTSDEPPLPREAELRRSHVVFDLAYRPRRTPLLERAAAAGAVTVEGIEMLVEQGALSFRFWTGLEAPVSLMREAALRALCSSVASLPGVGAPASEARAPAPGASPPSTPGMRGDVAR